MNGSIIRRIIGYVLILEGGLMLLPCIVALVYGERQGFAYLITAVGCLVLGYLLKLKKAKNTVFYLKEGCVATALSWIVLSVFGSIPFMLTGEIPSPINALFETVSGFTTTGASILTDVEAMSHCSLFWRSFTHWVGGMGVLVFLLAVVPLSGGSNINLMKAESPGPSVGKLVPKMRRTARILYVIYFAMTVVEIVMLLCGGMPLFDSLTLSFGSAGTGGFGIKNDSVASYSSYCRWVITVFMALFGINFNFYYFLLFRQFKKAFGMEEVRAYILIIIAATGIIFANTIQIYNNFSEALCKAAFQVSSVITTTGFSTADFNQWSNLSKSVLFLLMFIGACAGSTGGGLKVSRLLVGAKTVRKELGSYIHPKSVKKITLDGKPVEKEVIRATNVYFITYALIFVGSWLIVSLEDYDIITNLTAVASAFNNIGPGLELVGPSENFNFLSPISKSVLIFDMLAGRLELFPLLVLFNPRLWRERNTQIANRLRKKRG